MYKKLTLIACSILFAAITLNTEAKRAETSINDSWDFRMPGDTVWQKINIPHTYNLDAYNKREYYKGKALYRRNLHLDTKAPGKKYYLKFDAASKGAQISINGSIAGDHAGGYSSFIIDATPFIKEGNNTIEVTVDNGRQDIAPIWADFTFWGGIYRDVWLVNTPDIHFTMTDHGSEGIFISTPTVNEKEGTVKVIAKVENDSPKTANLEVVTTIYDPEGKELQTISRRQKVKPGATADFSLLSRPIEKPQLWSPESPTLYTTKTVLKDLNSIEVLDEKSINTAFRWFSFDGDKGFSLNGKPYKLRGVNRHQDQWPVGIALPDEAHRRDIGLMKDIGCNFIRIAHYPQDDALLEACDKLGLLVWEEIPIVNTVYDTPGFNDNCETNLVEMIRQHYNHPSVILWGYMNEILLCTPGPGKKEWPEFRDRIVSLAQRLEKRLKEEDPWRNSAMAFNMTNLYNEIGLNLEDVAGWNLYQGWYSGKLEDFDAFCEDQHKRYPDHPFIISEWGAGSDHRIHSLNPRQFDFDIEYQQKYIEHYLPFIEKKDWIAGCSYWNFIDFNVAERQESMPRVNNKGLFYNDRTPKDVAYYFKAMWRDDIPVVRIASRDWGKRMGDTKTAQQIKVYSNAPEVELFVNGKSAGTKKVENCMAVFDVIMNEGENALTASGTHGDLTAHDAMTVTLQPLPDPSRDEFAVNVGGNVFFTSDLSHLTWMPDQPYSSETGWGYLKGEPKRTTSEIFSTTDVPLYQAWLQGPVEYRIDAVPGNYELELLMCDVSRPAKQQANLLGQSDNEKTTDSARFDVEICGETLDKDLSPADGERFHTAFKRRYMIDAADGVITVKLSPIQGEPTLAGIKLRRL